MATLKLLRCKNCTRPLPEGTTVCPRCHTAHSVVSEVNPLQLTHEAANDYISFFQQQTADNPKNAQALFGMGLVYLGLRNYELAQRNFQLAVDQNPFDPDVYYYFALSLFAGQNPTHLSNAVTTRIEEWLNTACKRQSKRKYLILLMVLRQGAFIANGLQVHGEQPAELMARIRKMLPEPNELQEIREHVRITDADTLAWLQELAEGKAPKQTGREKITLATGEDFDDYLCAYVTDRVYDQVFHPSERDDLYYTDETDTNTVRHLEPLLDEQTREDFFRYQYEPQKPEPESKPFWPLWQAVKMTIGYALLFLLVAIVLAFEPGGLGVPNINVGEETTPEQVTAFFDRVYCLGYIIYGSDEDGQKTETEILGHIDGPVDGLLTEDVLEMRYVGLPRGWQGTLTIALFFLAPVLYLIRLIVVFVQNGNERRAVGRRNRDAKAQYQAELERYHTRPTQLEYVAFCQQYLAPKSTMLSRTGDPVTQALRQQQIDEHDMVGKILFVNYFDDTDENDVPSEDALDVLTRLYYVIAIPQRDKLLMLKNCWNTFSNRFEPCEVESVFYHNICSINRVGDELQIEKSGGTYSGIVLPSIGTSLFEYQDRDPSDPTTYSTTRTSDPAAFAKALDTLIATRKA